MSSCCYWRGGGGGGGGGVARLVCKGVLFLLFDEFKLFFFSNTGFNNSKGGAGNTSDLIESRCCPERGLATGQGPTDGLLPLLFDVDLLLLLFVFVVG